MTYVAWYFFIGFFFGLASLEHVPDEQPRWSIFLAGFLFWPTFIAKVIINLAEK